MFGMLVRIAIALVLAFFVSGLVGELMLTSVDQFIDPGIVMRIAERGWEHAQLAWPFALFAVAVAEFAGIRALAYYLGAGALVAIAAVAFDMNVWDFNLRDGWLSKWRDGLLTCGLLGGLTYWMVQGWRVGWRGEEAEAASRTRLEGLLGPSTVDQGRCRFCGWLAFLVAAVPLGLIGWGLLQDDPPTDHILRKAENEGTALLAKAGAPWASFSVKEDVGAVIGKAPDATAKAAVFEKAQTALAPFIGVAGVADRLEDRLTVEAPARVATSAQPAPPRPQEAPRVANAEAEARKKADEDAARRLAAEAETKRKADEEAARRTAEAEAKRKTEEETRRLAAEAEKRRGDEEGRRLAALSEAKRKSDEDAARRASEAEAKKKADEDVARRVAAEAEAKRKSDDEARRLAAIAEAKRKTDEDAARRIVAEAEAKSKADEEIARRTAAEADVKRKAEENAKRVAAEAETRRKSEEDAKRVAAEAENKRKADEAARRSAAEAEARRKVEEARTAAAAVPPAPSAVPAPRAPSAAAVAPKAPSAPTPPPPASPAASSSASAAAAAQIANCPADHLAVLRDTRVAFDLASTSPPASSGQLLDRLAAALQRCGDVALRVAGHTDRSGTPAANMEISRQRAQRIVDELVKRGVTRERLDVVGLGALRPISAAASGVAAPSRRVEFTAMAGSSATTPPPAVQAVCAQEISRARVTFGSAVDRVPLASAGQIDKIAAALIECRVPSIVIEGHTDAVGSAEFNLALSERRALAVRRALVDRGVPATVLTVTPLGKTRPLDTASTPAAHAANRRVELVMKAR